MPGMQRQGKRLLGTGAGVIFKGSGFYETDYKRQGQTCSSKSAPDTDAKSGSKPEKKNENKSESKSSSSGKKDKA